MVEKKGFDLLIDAFAAMTPPNPELGLVIGGDGPVRERLRHQVDVRGLSDRVLLPGTLSRGQSLGHGRTRASSSFRHGLSPLGSSFLEALRAGTPVVVSSRGGASEIVRHEVEGLVVDPCDAVALAGAIGGVIRDPERRSQMARAGRDRVVDYAWELVIERYLSLYASVLGESS